VSNTEFTYGAGLVRSLEAKMLTAEKILRMVDADTYESAFSVLNESGYARLLDKLENSFNFEELLQKEYDELKTLTNWVAPDSEIIKAIWLKHDFNNFKTIIKNKTGGVEEEKESGIPKQFRSIAEKILKQGEEDLQIIDLAWDKSYLLLLKKTADQAKVPLFTKYVSSKIDISNLKILIRTKEANLDRKYLSQMCQGGTIDEKKLAGYLTFSFEEISQKLKYTDYANEIREGINYYTKTKSFHSLERLFSGHLLKLVKDAKHITFGIEPILGFILAKEHEIKILRMIFTSKIKGISSQDIKERIALYYV